MIEQLGIALFGVIAVFLSWGLRTHWGKGGEWLRKSKPKVAG